MIKTKLKKPSSATLKFYNWSEVRDYIEIKYKLDIRHVDVDGEGGDFWLWLVTTYNVGNDSMLTQASFDPVDYEDEPKFVQKIIKIINDEFGSNVNFWISW